MLKVNATNIGAMPSPADVIFDALKSAIVEGELREGETLATVSLTPLRRSISDGSCTGRLRW